jgi:hypothetical protein
VANNHLARLLSGNLTETRDGICLYPHYSGRDATVDPKIRRILLLDGRQRQRLTP